tara:strand:- start:340 stop:525 length:186 start_codon:yes stop_codon:yes gene_type:complete
MKKWLISQMLKSKKFWYTVAGCVVTLLSDKWGVDPATSQSILYSLIALVLGQGIADINVKK